VEKRATRLTLRRVIQGHAVDSRLAAEEANQRKEAHAMKATHLIVLTALATTTLLES
jgi:hypothetical protein